VDGVPPAQGVREDRLEGALVPAGTGVSFYLDDVRSVLEDKMTIESSVTIVVALLLAIPMLVATYAVWYAVRSYGKTSRRVELAREIRRLEQIQTVEDIDWEGYGGDHDQES